MLYVGRVDMKQMSRDKRACRRKGMKYGIGICGNDFHKGGVWQ